LGLFALALSPARDHPSILFFFFSLVSALSFFAAMVVSVFA